MTPRLGLVTGLIVLLAGCGLGGGSAARALPPAPAAITGPAGDYPVVVGDPYEIEGVGYVPLDTMNYDEVGYAVADDAGGAGVSASHRTLPLPSYVEVTSLETGRTSVVRIRRRGPMQGGAETIIALSPGALAQLEMTAGTPVRVRRVNPMEPERAKLRSGEPASLRMDTPKSLVEVLRRKLPVAPAVRPLETVEKPAAKLPETVTAEAPPVRQLPRMIDAVDPDPAAIATLPPIEDSAVAAPAPPRVPPPAPASAVRGGLVVQAGAFSSRSRAERVAQVIGGQVSQSGALFRVRTGPFADRSAAQASLAKVQAAGYREARIFTND